MVTGELKSIFLSASIPLPERDPKYYGSADVFAIRDAVISLATTVLPSHKMIWGGHPSITPLISFVLQKRNIDIQSHVTIYQSKFFEDKFPEDNNKFNNVILIEKEGDKPQSLLSMRNAMLRSSKFSAGVFIGGMEGVEDEYEMFKTRYPDALILPMASTGAAAKLIYDSLAENKEPRLANDYAYASVFQSLLIDKI